MRGDERDARRREVEDGAPDVVVGDDFVQGRKEERMVREKKLCALGPREGDRRAGAVERDDRLVDFRLGVADLEADLVEREGVADGGDGFEGGENLADAHGPIMDVAQEA